MTSTDRRQCLESHGYQVCKNSFPGQTCPLWYVRLPDPDGNIEPASQLFINLETGLWRDWDDATMRSFDQGPWHAQSAGAGNVEDDPLITPFVRQCLDAGMELEPGHSFNEYLIDGWDTGNRYMTYQGRRYLVFSRQQSMWLSGYRLPPNNLALADVIGEQQPPKATPPPTPRPMTYGQRVDVPQGRSQSLF